MAKILVVDDHPVNRQFIVKLFGYFEHTLFEAADGEEGLIMAQRVAPDLIISDIVMPNKDGEAFIKELRQIPAFAKTPVIFYTASHRVPAARELANECGVQVVLHKPAKPEDILRTVNGLLGIGAQVAPRPSVVLDAETMRLAALVELGLDMTRERNPAGLLRKFTQALQFILRADAGGAIILDPNGKKDYAALICHSDGLPGPTDPRGAAHILGELSKWQVSARIVNPAIDHRVLGLPTPIRSLLCVTVPIPNDPSHTSWLFAANKLDSVEFSAEDQRLAVTLAMQLAISFENARLHAEASQRAEELQAVIVERKRAEVQVRIQAAALTAAANGVVIADTQGNAIWINPAFTRMTGFTEADAIGKNLRFLKSGRHDRAYYEDLWTTIQSGRVWSGETINRRKDGSLYIEEQTITPVHDESGEIARFIAVKQDIAERKRAEFERDRIFEQSLNLLCINGFDGRIKRLNQIWESTLGFAREELLGEPFMNFVHPDDHAAAAVELQKLAAGDGVTGLILRAICKDGSYKSILWNATPFLDQNVFYATGHDITERKLLEDQYLAAREQLHHVVTSSPAVLFTLAGNGEPPVLVWVSDNIRALLGFSVEETRDTNWWPTHVHPDDLDVNATIREQLSDRGHAIAEYRIRNKDGTYRWIRAEKRLLRDAEGQALEVVGSWSDITERKQLEGQYRQAQKMEAIGKLAGGIAHDFNNLLTIIVGYSDLYLGKLRREDPLHEPLTEIRRAGERATDLTRQLLAFSRKQVLKPVVLELNKTIGDMEKMLRRLIGEDVLLELLRGTDLWTVKADPGQMEQVVMNILVNARDAMPRGGKVLIETKNVELTNGYVQTHSEAKPGEYVLVAITDTGCGMDATIMARIFEPFFTTKGPAKGTGLGLATVFGIVKQSGGHLEVYSEVGHGTTFKVYLPRDRSGEPVANLSRISAPASGGTETILLVEDDDGVRNLTMAILKELGYTVIEARHGGDALMICETRAEPIDLIITDVVMPYLSGRQLTDRLASTQPTMKVIYMSGYTDDAVVHHGVLESGMPFLHKPFAPEALARKVREVLDAAPLPHQK